MPCWAHVQWLDLGQTELHCTLIDPDQLRRVVSDLPHPGQQRHSAEKIATWKPYLLVELS